MGTPKNVIFNYTVDKFDSCSHAGQLANTDLEINC